MANVLWSQILTDSIAIVRFLLLMNSSWWRDYSVWSFLMKRFHDDDFDDEITIYHNTTIAQWFRNVVREKKRDYVGKIPKLRGGVWPKPTPYFSLLFPIQELIKWHNKFYKNGKKMWKFPNWGGGWGGSAAWEFFPHNPVFFSDNDP